MQVLYRLGEQAGISDFPAPACHSNGNCYQILLGLRFSSFLVPGFSCSLRCFHLTVYTSWIRKPAEADPSWGSSMSFLISSLPPKKERWKDYCSISYANLGLWYNKHFNQVHFNYSYNNSEGTEALQCWVTSSLNLLNEKFLLEHRQSNLNYPFQPDHHNQRTVRKVLQLDTTP